MPETHETLADVYAEHYHDLLRQTAEMMLHDWSEATKIAEEARSRLEARRAEIEANAARYQDHENYYGVLLGAVCGTFTRVAVERKKALGYYPPECEEGIRSLDLGEAEAAQQRVERAALIERINALPPTFREALHGWLQGRSVDPATGVRVRVGLKLLNRRAAA